MNSIALMVKNVVRTPLCLLFAIILAIIPVQNIFALHNDVANVQTATDGKGVVVDGVVVDKKSGEPLIGASVAIWSNGKLLTGTSTDMTGAFKITSSVDKFEVQVSFIGYSLLKFNSSSRKLTNMRIELEEDAHTLNDVVVTGFVTKNKQTFTGSATQISGVELKQVSGTNLIGAIAALTPGMSMVQNTAQGSNPNHVPELVLRGMSSFSNSGQQVNQPTIILDGTEISMQELYDLDMNEIENITVLKDASATALYGSKAANGVIVITRKPIKESTVRVQYNFTGNLQFPKLDDYNVLNASEKLEYERLAGLYTAAEGALSSTTGLPLQYELDEIYNQRYKAIVAGQNSDWLSQPARVAFSHDHSLRVYGGASNIRYELTGRFGDTKGVMKDDYRKRYSLGFKIDYFVNKAFQISNRTTYTQIKTQDTPYGSFDQYVQMNPYERMYNADGTPNTNLAWNLNNPLYEAKLGSYSRDGSSNLTNSTDFRWDINKMFLVTGHFNLSSDIGWSDIFTSPKSLQFKDETDLSKKGQLTKADSRGLSYNGNVVATFNKMFKDESLISISSGWEINHANSRSATTQVIGFFNDNLSFIGNAAGYPTDRQPYGSQEEMSDVGLFVTGNFSFRNRYFADATWRMTGSSQFGENNRYGHFWSGGLGWNVANESFMESVRKHIDIFKVRASMGYTGKVSFSPFQAMTMYEYKNIYEYKNGIGAIPVTIGNVDLTWERTMNYNIGLDLSLFNRRLNLVVDAYIRNTTDLLLDKAKAPSTGVTTAKSNLGEMQNKGLEFQIDGYVFRTNDFYWRLATMAYLNRNKITKINSALEEINKENQENAYTTLTPLPQYAEGESVTALKLVRSAGIDPATGKEIYIKRNGERTFKYDPNDRVYIGDTEPRLTGSFSTNLYWKGFGLYAMFNYRLGAWVYNTTRVSKVEGSDPHYNADQRVFDNRWKQPGDVALYKNIADSSRPEQTDRFAEEENTLSLGSLNLSYEFDEKVCKKLKLRNLRAGINFTDILRFSTVKIERGTTYLYSEGCEFYLSLTL
ncbi:MAG: SusC/RagA family TonB-linked outer membrane protein [Bacteroidaceae bacterium]|nr:SusC/RagA family TonB-linked outer membrane protein [Bacteroidaceae bacterium]